MKTHLCANVGLALAITAPRLCPAQAEFYGIGDLAGGSYLSVAIEISGDGRTAAGASEGQKENDEASYQPISWNLTEGIEALTEPHKFGEARGVSRNGFFIVGYMQTGPYEQAAAWSVGGSTGRTLGVLPGGTRSWANDVTEDGRVIVGTSTSDASPDGEGFTYSIEAGMRGLGDLPGGARQSSASAASAYARKIVGWGKTDNGTEAIVWDFSNGTMTGLRDLRGGVFASQAHGISPDGRWIVGEAHSHLGQRAVLWEDSAAIQDLGPGIAYDVSASGTLVVGSTTEGEAFIWDRQEGMRNLKEVFENHYGLDLTGWKLVRASALSDDGTTIAGDGFNPQGDYEGWIVKLRQIPAFIDIEYDGATARVYVRWPAGLTGHYLQSSRNLRSWETLRSVEKGFPFDGAPIPSPPSMHFRLISARR